MAFDKPCLVKQQVVDKQAKPNGTKPLAVKLVLDIKHLTSFPSLGENAHECVHIWDGGGSGGCVAGYSTLRKEEFKP